MFKIKLKAYSIVEASLSISMIGLISIIILTFSKYNDYKVKKEINRYKANYIRKAIEGYVATNGFLPNAADENGVEQHHLFEGFVPYKALGIPKSYMNDAYNKPFRIIFNRNFVLSEHKNEIIIPIHWTYQMLCVLNIDTFNSYKTLEEANNKFNKQKDIVSFKRLYERKIVKNKYDFYMVYRVYDKIKYQNFIKNSLNLKNYKVIRYYYPKQENIPCDQLVYYNIIHEEIAWAMIDSRHKNYNDAINVDNTFYYQTRFNICNILQNSCEADGCLIRRTLDFKKDCFPEDENSGWQVIYNEH